MHKEFCTTKCLKEFMKCVKKQEEVERQDSNSKRFLFPDMGAALDWLKSHTTQAPPGSHVIVAGVGFVIVIVGGALFLSPI